MKNPEFEIFGKTHDKELEAHLRSLYESIIESKNAADEAAKKYLSIRMWLTDQRTKLIQMKIAAAEGGN